MGKHYSQKDNLISIMKEISKKTPRGIVNGDTTVGHITWQMYLMRDYLKLDGTPLANASNDYTDLLKFAQDNELITADTDDKSLFKYDSTTDVLTLPNYIDLVLQGGNTVEEKEAGLPNIKGYAPFINNGSGAMSESTGTNMNSGALTWQVGAKNYTLNWQAQSGTTLAQYIGVDASKSNSIYSDTVNTVQPPAITLIPQIKYRKSTTMYEQIDAVVNYSTTEKVVGTWIDGKPLYQKTFVGTTPDTADVNTVVFTITNSNVAEIVSLKGYLRNTTSTSVIWQEVNSCRLVNDQYLWWYARQLPDGSELYLQCQCSANYISLPCYITIQYTKTTD